MRPYDLVSAGPRNIRDDDDFSFLTLPSVLRKKRSYEKHETLSVN